MLNIGTNAEAVKEVRMAILGILESGAEQKTLREALKALRGSVSVDGAMITECTFTGK